MKQLVSLVSCGVLVVCVGVILSACQDSEKRDPRAYPGSGGSVSLEKTLSNFNMSLPSCGAHGVRYYEKNELLSYDTLYLTFSTSEPCSQEFLLSAAGSSYELSNAALRGSTVTFPSEWEMKTLGWKSGSGLVYAKYRFSRAGLHVNSQFRIAVDDATPERTIYIEIVNTNTAGAPS
jgi:hypothetical protein